MPLAFDTPAGRLVLAVAAAFAAAAAATLAFDTDGHGARQTARATLQRPDPLPVAADPTDRPVAPGAAESPAVLDRVLVRPPGATDDALDRDDRPANDIALVPPPDSDALPQADAMPPSEDAAARPTEPSHDAAAAVARAPDRPAASPAGPARRRPAAPAPAREEPARMDRTGPDASLARRLNREGIALIESGRPGQAIVLFEQAAALQPRDAEVLGNLGYACMLMGDYDAARHHLRRALAFAPDRSATWLNLGQTYAELGQRDLAVDAVVVGYRNASRKTSVRAALLAAATGSRHSRRWREAAGIALARIDNG